jgi:hypothetical protein
MSRTTFPAGSGYAAWNSLTLNMREAWKVDEEFSLFKVPSATLGDDHDSRMGDAMAKITATPKVFGTSLSGQLAAYFPWTNPKTQLGTQIFPASDLPFVINLRDGKIVTYSAAAVTKMPAMTFAPDKPLIGGVEWTSLIADGAALGDASALSAVSSGSYTEPQWDPSDELFDTYTLSVGSTTSLTSGATTNGSTSVTVASTDGVMVGQVIGGTGITGGTTVAAITSPTALTLSAAATATNTGLTLTLAARTFTPDKDGITFTPTASFEPVKPAMKATANMRLTGITAVLEFRPLDMDVADFYALLPAQGWGIGLGKSVGTRGVPLDISGSAAGKAKLTAHRVARAGNSALAFSNKEPRADKVQLQLMQHYASGWQPLFTATTV